MSKEKRDLSPAELKRKADFELVCNKMEQDGYLRSDLTIGIVRANVLAVVLMLPFVVLTSLLYFSVNSLAIDDGMSNLVISYFLFIVGMILLFVAHEAIHGLIWSIFAENHFKSISFGVIWKYLTPYCSCSSPLRKGQYILGSAMPTLILGFGLVGLAIAIGNLWLFLLAEIMIIGGGGDFLIICKMLMYKSKAKNIVYYDHPYELGLVVFER